MVHGLYRAWGRGPQRPIINNNFVMRGAPQGHHGCGNRGFWGGFLGGFLGGSLLNFGGLFGFGRSTTMMTGGMPMMTGMFPTTQFYTNNYDYLNQHTPGQQQNSDVTILQKHFKDYIISERNGQFIATDKDGNTIIGDSFEDMLEKLGGQKPASQNPESEELAAIKLAAERQGRLMEVREEAAKFNQNKEVIAAGAQIQVIDDPKNANFAQYKLIINGKEEAIVRDITAAYAALGINAGTATEELEDDSASSKGTKGTESGATDTSKGTSGAGSGVTDTSQGTSGAGSGNNLEELEDDSNLNETADTGDRKWSIRRSPGLLSDDAWLYAADGNVYKIKCWDNSSLNYGEKKVHKTDKGMIETNYHKIKGIFNRATGESLPATVDKETNRIKVKVDENKWIYLEDFLANPDQGSTYMKKLAEEAEAEKRNKTAQANADPIIPAEYYPAANLKY